MKKTFGMLALFLAVAGSVWGDAPRAENRLIDRLVGRWVLSGTIAGRKTTHDVSAEWVLNHGYVRIHEVSREKDATGLPAYEAIVFVGTDPAGATYSCLWLDSTGSWGLSAEAMGHAKPGPAAIPFIFTDPDGRVSFENVFAYDQARDAWTWTMNNVKDGKRTLFGHVVLEKQ